MRRIGVLVLVHLLLVSLALVSGEAIAGWPPTMRVALRLDSPSDLLRLYQLGAYLVGRDREGRLLAEVDDEGLAKLLGSGFRPEVVVADLEKEWAAIRAAGEGTDSQYHSYSELTADLQALAATYPEICALSNMGQSVQGRELWVLKISDNVAVNENEPEIRFDGNIHGDEKIGQELAYLLAELLVESYGSDPQITELVDSREIWILPCVNPDGMMAGMRYNANWVDCNRDYGYQWAGDGGSPYPISQPETEAMTEYILARPYSMSMTYHAGTELFLWSWCYTNDRPPSMHEHDYVGSTYGGMAGYSSGQCGWVLYNVNGGSLDYDLGVNGSLGQCVEISYSKTPPASQIDVYFERNRAATLWMIEESGYGIEGVVTDAATGEPLPAVIRVLGMYGGLSELGYADPELGDFHKYLRPGTYDIEVWANDHELVTLQDVVVLDGQATTVNVQLAAAADGYAWRTIYCNDTSWGDTNATLTFDAIGPPDEAYYSIGVNGYIVLDMGETTPIWDGQGEDFTVHEAPGEEEGCEVLVASDWRGPWYSVGDAWGTSSFDISGTPLEEARYVKLVDDGDGSSSAPDPGYDLDAISTTHIIPGCGFLVLDRALYACDGEVGISLIDVDLDLNPEEPDTAQVLVTSDSDPEGETVELTESGPATGEFLGTAQLSSEGEPGTIQVSHGDGLAVTYEDAACQGAPQTVEITATVDCVPPLILSVEVAEVTEDSAVITWVTDEPASSRVRYGAIAPPQEEAFLEEAVTVHRVELTGLESCTNYVFEVESADIAGNISVDDNGGEYYLFATPELQVLLYANMDLDPGWQTEGLWAWGQPTGQGGEYGEPDPTSGYTGLNVYGYNLNGDSPNYMPVRYLTTTAFDCSDAEQVYLEFQRWLGVEQPTYDHATLEVSGDGGASWVTVWENTATMNGGEWELVQYDLTTWAAGQPAVKLRWGMGPTDSGWRFCGWNIDDVLVSYTTECQPPTFTPAPPTPTPEPTATPTEPPPTPSPSPTTTPLPPTATPSPTAEATASPEPSPTRLPPSATPAATPSPEPTGEPQPSATPAASPSPTTPPNPDHVVCDLTLNQEIFHGGDPFLLTRTAWNPGPQLTCEEWLILDVFGSYWFWPSWTSSIDFVLVVLPEQQYDEQVRLEFTWPEGSFGALSGLRFWGAFLEPGSSRIIGDYDMVEFGYE